MQGISEKAFRDAYCQRVRELREARGWTQEQMAEALNIPADRYRKYEGRSPLPPYLVERFALFVGRDVAFILTGKAAPIRPRRAPPPAPDGPSDQPARRPLKRGAWVVPLRPKS